MSAARRRWDAVVIGSGSGGRSAADGLADAGLEVAMVEHDLVGGECPYWACMPSKAMLRPLEAVSAAARVPGVSARIADLSAVLEFREGIVRGRRDAAKAEDYRRRGVTILRGHGRLAGPGAVDVDGVRHETARTVIATGSTTDWPDIAGLASAEAWTNREVMELRSVPESAIVLGAGPVGAEVAQMLSRYGARVTVVDPAPHLLPGEDPSVGDLLGRRFREEGMTLALGAEASEVGREGDGTRVALDDGTRVVAERLVVATGRRPVLEDLGLETVGIEAGEEGIPVDARCRAADGVWAVGDVTGIAQFTHVASYQGRIVSADILGRPVEADYRAVPRSVFCDPEVSAVGLTAEGAREQGIDAVTASVDLGALERSATYGREVGGLVGVVADRPAGVLVGAHGVGPLASEWMHVAVLAVRARVPVATMRDLIAQFPTFAEALVTAVRDLPLEG
jgi:dihydrolipoamide dehydrogenase